MHLHTYVRITSVIFTHLFRGSNSVTCVLPLVYSNITICIIPLNNIRLNCTLIKLIAISIFGY